GNFILSEVILIFIQKIIKAGEILLVVKIHRLFHLRGGFCPSLIKRGGSSSLFIMDKFSKTIHGSLKEI
ncbi:hypothetical protein, partial [Heyndrickxia sporothermodurans]|uniref:hypothetical protein n=1 Tax=Heyndrickxia sporothermodurans TaxID=46224 RepID=UPI001F207096